MDPASDLPKPKRTYKKHPKTAYRCCLEKSQQNKHGPKQTNRFILLPCTDIYPQPLFLGMSKSSDFSWPFHIYSDFLWAMPPKGWHREDDLSSTLNLIEIAKIAIFGIYIVVFQPWTVLWQLFLLVYNSCLHGEILQDHHLLPSRTNEAGKSMDKSCHHFIKYRSRSSMKRFDD